jgi:ABC-type nitrate/sulfonate/bicarbonate transport system permease component
VAGWVRRHEPAVVTLASLLVFVAVWQAVTVFGHLGPSVFAGPGPVFQTLVGLAASGELVEHLVATGSVFLAGFVLSAISGVLIGLVLGTSEDVEAILGPYLMALYAAPRVAFISLLLVWMGIGPSSKIALVFLSAFFPIALNTMTGARSVDAVLLRAARSYGAGRRQQFFKVVLPFSIPYILAGLRLGVGRALIGAFVAEMFGATAGIGYLIVRAGYEFHAATLLAGVLVLAACSVLLTEALRWAGHRLAPWQRDTVI